MDTNRFDDLVRALQHSDSRRSAITALLGGIGIALTPGMAPGAEAKKSAKRRRARRGKSRARGRAEAIDRRSIEICHAPGTPDQQTMVIPRTQLNAHMRHGDAIGPCPCVPTCAGKCDGASDGCGGSCTVQSCPTCQTCNAGTCVNADGAACNAGDLCTIDDTCLAGVCVKGPRRICPTNSNQCKQDVCNAQTGECETQNKEPFTPCNDGNPCTTSDHCDFEGQCVGTPTTCQGAGRICCPSGPYAGTCRGGDAASCSSNIGCCSDNCVIGTFCSF